jgi:hypothetical protein
MEEHAAALKLRETRERIRAMLIPDPETGRIESRSFPRSAIMRFAFDPRAGKVLMAGLSLLMMFKARGTVTRAAVLPAMIPMLMKSFGAVAGLLRR